MYFGWYRVEHLLLVGTLVAWAIWACLLAQEKAGELQEIEGDYVRLGWGLLARELQSLEPPPGVSASELLSPSLVMSSRSQMQIQGTHSTFPTFYNFLFVGVASQRFPGLAIASCWLEPWHCFSRARRRGRRCCRRLWRVWAGLRRRARSPSGRPPQTAEGVGAGGVEETITPTLLDKLMLVTCSANHG